MNILVIAHYQDDGSPYVSFVHNQVVEYKRQGHNVIVVVPTVWGKRYKNLRVHGRIIIDNIPIWYVKCISLSNFGKYNINNKCGYDAVSSCVKSILKEQSIDIIHAHTIGFDGYIAVKLKEKFNIPVVITTHGSDTIAEINNGRGEYIISICKKADYIVAVSSKLRDMLLELCPILSIHVILNGFKLLPTLTVEKPPYTFLQVGSLIQRKKVDITISAFAKVLTYYSNAKLEIIGEGIEEKKLKQMCIDLNIEKSVTFYGFLENNIVLEHMAKNQVFVMPSINEGFGIVYLEAMSQACIVIGSKGEGIEDLITDSVNGFLVIPDDIDQLADIFIKCLESPKHCNEMIRKGIETSQGLTWEANAQKYIQLFRQLLTT